MLIALAFVALACGTAPVHLAPPPLHITLTFTRDVSPSLVRRTLDEADAVWRPSGVTFAWDAESRGGAPAALQIVVDDERGMASGGLPPLGWIAFDAQDTPGRLIHLSYANAVALLDESSDLGTEPACRWHSAKPISAAPWVERSPTSSATTCSRPKCTR